MDVIIMPQIHSIAIARRSKRAGDDRRPKGRHLLTYQRPCQWIPGRCQSSLRTGSCRNADLWLIFPIRECGPSELRMAMAESIVQYRREYCSGSMKSLMLLPGGAER